MNEQLQAALSDLISKSLSGIDAAAGFLSDEIPDVVAQLLMWHGVYNLLIAMLGVALMLSTTYLTVKYSGKGGFVDESLGDVRGNYKVTLTHDDDGDLGEHFPVVCFSTIPFLIGALLFNIEWLQIWIAPKVWLIEYAASLAK